AMAPPAALSWLLAACCLCALPRGSGTQCWRHELQCGSQGVKAPLLTSNLCFSKQLALCFSQWMELSDQPQISSTVLDLCYSIFNTLYTNE
ncbi:NMS protein, partial [Chordeiles acutipennis]|nr:NMS protein [Chordeiles acutipennis]